MSAKVTADVPAVDIGGGGGGGTNVMIGHDVFQIDT